MLVLILVIFVTGKLNPTFIYSVVWTNSNENAFMFSCYCVLNLAIRNNVGHSFKSYSLVIDIVPYFSNARNFRGIFFRKFTSVLSDIICLFECCVRDSIDMCGTVCWTICLKFCKCCVTVYVVWQRYIPPSDVNGTSSDISEELLKVLM